MTKTGKDNVITVHVVAYRKAPGLHIQAAVTPELLDLTGLPEGEMVIQWKLDTKGYHFPEDGRAIVFTSPGAEKSFGPVELDRTRSVATVRGKNSDGLAYAYNVTVVEEATGLSTVLDPIVQNKGR